MLRSAILLFACTGLLAACQGPASYVNIPAEPGDVASHNVDRPVVRDVIVAAVRRVMEEREMDEPTAIFLPGDASVLSHQAVVDRVGEPAVSPHDEQMQYLHEIRVQSVRIRPQAAEVDLVVPGLGGAPQLVTAYLDWRPVDGWVVSRTRPWRVPVDQTL